MRKRNIPSPNFAAWQAQTDSTNEWQKILDQLLDRSGLWDGMGDREGTGTGGPKETKSTQSEKGTNLTLAVIDL